MTRGWTEEMVPLLHLVQSARPEDLVVAADRAAALLDDMRANPSAAAGGYELDDVRRLRRLAVSAADLYQGWLTILAARTAGYDGCGAPAPLEIGSVRVEG